MKLLKHLPKGILLAFTVAVLHGLPVMAADAVPADKLNNKLSRTIKTSKLTYAKVTLSAEVKQSIAEASAGRKNPQIAASSPTGSMKPTFDEHYIVVLEDANFGELRRGDVPLTARGTTIFMHRITDRDMSGFITQGDACKARDVDYTCLFSYQGKRVVAAIDLRDGHIVYMQPQTHKKDVASLSDGLTP